MPKKLCESCLRFPKFYDFKFCERCLAKTRKEIQKSKYLTKTELTVKRFPWQKEWMGDTKGK